MKHFCQMKEGPYLCGRDTDLTYKGHWVCPQHYAFLLAHRPSQKEVDLLVHPWAEHSTRVPHLALRGSLGNPQNIKNNGKAEPSNPSRGR